MAFTRILAVSPDGSKVVYAAGDWANPSLRVRRLDSLTDEPIPGTEGGIAPFFSPDGEWVAFFDSDELKKVRLPGGDVVALCEAHVATSGTWADNGWIYFTHGESRLARVRDDGGQPEELPYEVFGPHALPGDRGVLVTQVLPDEPSVRKDTAPIALLSHDGQITRLIDGGYAPSYVQSGHLVFMRGSALLAVPFDLDGLRIDASPVTVVQDIWTDSIWALGQYAVSPGGTLVYIPGSDYARTVPTWIDRQGAETPLSLPAEVYNTFQLSPDRRKLAIQVTGSQDQIHVHDLARDTFTRLTLEGSNSYPAWSRDGEQIYFASMRQGKQRMFRRRVDGSGDAEPVLTDEQSAMIRGPFRYPYGESPDGRFLVFASWGDPEQGGDVWALPLDGASDPQALVATRANEIIPEVSPDGKWILYLSNKTGDYETYVRPFPDVAEREWQVSDGGGFDARWSPAGDEILYRKGSMQFWSVRYTTNPDFTPGTPELLFESDAHDSAGFSFDVSADGERMLINKPAISLRNTPPVTLVTNWDSELEGLVPTGP
jgi:serine/threonine-protein kinase